MNNNPIEIFYCWQAVVTAIMVYMLTQFVKAVLPYAYNAKTEKQKIFIKRVLLVAIPPILGFIAGALIPIHPEVLIEYVTSNTMSKYQAMLIYGGWGAAVGQFADYGYSKVKKLLGDVNTNRQSQTPPEE